MVMTPVITDRVVFSFALRYEEDDDTVVDVVEIEEEEEVVFLLPFLLNAGMILLVNFDIICCLVWVFCEL